MTLPSCVLILHWLHFIINLAPFQSQACWELPLLPQSSIYMQRLGRNVRQYIGWGGLQHKR